MQILITGGSGFIGANFIYYVLANSDHAIINLDKLTYSGNQENLRPIENHHRYNFVHGDICNENIVHDLVGAADIIVHFAAESHVDRSIQNSREFVDTNILGTQVLLHAALHNSVSKFVQISTDEVYGSLDLADPARFTESSALRPNSPYAATKLAAEMLARSYWKTYDLPVIITRSSNNYGPYQYPEKVIPLFVTNLLCGKKVPLYGDGLNIRDWIHVEDNCSAIFLAMEQGTVGEAYNIGSDNEVSNIELTKTILDSMGFSEDMIEYVPDRLGHDRRYAIDSTKIRNELGWKPERVWPIALHQTVEWYRSNAEWWEKLRK